MTKNEFNQLAGRIAAIGRMATAIVAELEDRGVIDGIQFANAIRNSVRTDDDSRLFSIEMQQELKQLADSIDNARNVRSTQEWKFEHHSRCNLPQVVFAEKAKD